jgi:hypothetical protein
VTRRVRGASYLDLLPECNEILCIVTVSLVSLVWSSNERNLPRFVVQETIEFCNSIAMAAIIQGNPLFSKRFRADPLHLVQARNLDLLD